MESREADVKHQNVFLLNEVKLIFRHLKIK